MVTLNGFASHVAQVAPSAVSVDAPYVVRPATKGDVEAAEAFVGGRKSAVAAVHDHCGVFTQPAVACGILDLIGWTADADLLAGRLLEPSCGDGSFLVPAAERLLESARRSEALNEPALADVIRAFEFHPPTAERARQRVRDLLKAAGLSLAAAERVADRWVRCEDFLLATDLGTFTHVVGNPPYMRWSKLPGALRAAYEERLPTHAARGDLCLAFVCRAAELTTSSGGRVAFLCADRWLRCAYGEKARIELGKTVRLATHFEVHSVPVFLGRKVGAYAAITVLDRDLEGGTEVREVASMKELLKRLRAGPAAGGKVHSINVLRGGGSAVLAEAGFIGVFERMMEGGMRLGDAGVDVRCGLALGAAPVFIVGDGSIDIEADRLVPYLRAEDLSEDGQAVPAMRLINVWSTAGDLVDLSDYPKLRAHMESHRETLTARACVTRPEQWFRTIDRLDPIRVAAPKILVAGMAKSSRVALSSGGAQPSNALYSITSIDWPLEALFALFRIGVLDVFATVFAPRFSGGSKRFDGNFLRQVRIPLWSDVDYSLRKSLLAMDVTTVTPDPELIAGLYGVHTAAHRKALARAIARGVSA